MLAGMRRAFETGVMRWVLIVLLTILAVSFAIWGIGDIFRGFGRERLATVGSVEIPAERFREEYDRARQAISRRAGQPVTAEQARAFGLHEQILQRMIAEAALDERARQLLVGVSDAEIARGIAEDPDITGGGPFNRAAFQQLLFANNLTEQAYVAQRRGAVRRSQIIGGLTAGIEATTVHAEIQHRFQNEKRQASYVVLPAERFSEVAPPTDQQLADFYSLVAASFRAPERRTAEVLILTPQAIAARTAVSDEDARAFYEINQTRFGTPERRQVLQLTFPTREAAEQAVGRLAEGVTFEALAQELGQSPDLGLLTRAEIIDPAAANAAFGLAAGETSGPVQGRFGWLLLRVAAVEAASVRPFDEVKDEIKRDMSLERARRQVFDVHDRVEEDRLSALRLPDIAERHGLQLVTLSEIDRQGRRPDGTTVEVPGGRAVIDAVFAAQQGADNEGVQLREVGGYVWVDLREVTRERDRPLAEVRDEVAQRWTEEQRRSQVSRRAAELVERIRGGAAFEAVATELGLDVQQTPEITRRESAPGFSRAAVDELFRVPEGGVGSATAEDGVGRILFQVTKVEVPPFDPAQDTLGAEIGPALQNEIAAVYLGQVERELGVWVNRTAVDRIAGGGALAN
jgi:peptidyl-prolyl cis-trans isomerase D